LFAAVRETVSVVVMKLHARSANMEIMLFAIKVASRWQLRAMGRGAVFTFPITTCRDFILLHKQHN